MLESSVHLLLLLISHSVVTGQQTCSENGAIQLIGINTATFAAGRLEICVDGVLRAVYDGSWEQREADLVCNQLGFPGAGAMPCTGSCLGASSLQQGYTDFISCNNAARILDCGSASDDGHFPNINAGVICTTGDTPIDIPTELPTDALTPCPEVTTVPTFTPSTTCDCTNCNTCPTEGQDLDTPTTTSDSPRAKSGQERVETDKSMAVGTALGVVCALLLSALVGVVMGWAWFFCRKRPMHNTHREMEANTSYISTSLPLTDKEVDFNPSQPEEMEPNPCYVATSLPKEMEPNPCYTATSLPKEMEANPCYVPTSLPKEMEANPCYVPTSLPKEMEANPCYVPTSLPKEMEANPCYVPTSLPKEMEANPCYVPTSLEPNPCYTPTSLPQETEPNPYSQITPNLPNTSDYAAIQEIDFHKKDKAFYGRFSIEQREEPT